MNDTHDQQRSFVARWALFLFIFGLLAPLVLILLVLAFSTAKAPWEAVQRAVPLAIALGLIAEMIALILGIVGRQDVAGKIAWIGSAVVLGLALIVAGSMLIEDGSAAPPAGKTPTSVRPADAEQAKPASK